MSVPVNDKNLGHSTAYAYAKSKGYTGTEEEFAQLMANYATVGQEAAQSAADAAQSASDAAGSAADAETAKTAAQTAKTGAETAQTGAQTAKTAAETAQGKAETAQGKAETAQAAAESAKTAAAGSASAAATSATNAGNSATAAAGSATAAQTAKTGAETAQAAAETAKTGAETAAASVSASAAQIETNKQDISDLKEDFSDISEYGSENVCPVKSGSYSPLTITVEADGKGNYTINGTASGGNAHFNLFSDSSSFPTGIKAGDKILAKVNSTNTAIRFYVMWWVNGSKVETDANWLSDGYKYFDIPSNATGMEIRLTVRNGTATNNDVLTPFIFADKTKYEFNQEIDKNATDIALVTSHMPMGYSPMEVTAISGLVNKWNEMVTPTGYAYVKQAVNVGETYKVSGWYYGGNFPAYLFLNGSSVVSFHNTDATGAFKNIEVTVPATATHIVINGYTDCPASIADYGMVDAGSADSRDSVVVGVGDSYNYNNINTAVTENTGRIVAVDYGTYETEIENLATNKTIIGKDVDLCVLTGTNKDYDHPPIEIAGGIIKHFTVNMQNNSSAEHKGYCLHSDHSNCANNKLVVTDCDFSCTGQHSIGMGIYPSEEVIFKNCTFDQLDNTNESVPFFCHNSGSSDGVGVVRFHNCYFKGYGNCMKLQGWGSNASIQFEFIDCTCISETYGTTDDCVWTDYVRGSTHDASRMHEFSGKFTLLASSHGNNVSVLNA